jgi:hypothetical protein
MKQDGCTRTPIMLVESMPLRQDNHHHDGTTSLHQDTPPHAPLNTPTHSVDDAMTQLQQEIHQATLLMTERDGCIKTPPVNGEVGRLHWDTNTTRL